MHTHTHTHTHIVPSIFIHKHAMSRFADKLMKSLHALDFADGGTLNPLQADHPVPRPVQALRYEVLAASAGLNHSSFVTAGGTIYTCG
jgi:hypothetical protein